VKNCSITPVAYAVTIGAVIVTKEVSSGGSLYIVTEQPSVGEMDVVAVVGEKEGDTEGDSEESGIQLIGK
jgi:hypothetical protein